MQLKVNETTHLESLSQKLKFRGFIPFGAWAEAKRKAKTGGLLTHQLRTKCARQGFHTFYPHAGSLASAEERQEQPASAGFFLLAVSTGANLVWSTTQGVAVKDIMNCQRCGEFKDRHWFPSEMETWYQLCNRCIRSPSGAMPLPQEERDRNEHQTKPNASNAI